MKLCISVADEYFNPLPNNNFLDVTKLKAFADDVAKIMIFLFDRAENAVVKGKCWLLPFSPFPTVFSKAFFFRVVKIRDCVVKS